MKKITATFIALFLTLLACSVMALDTPSTGFGVGTTNGAGTLSTVIVSARSANGGAPAVSFVSATSDLAGSKVQFYRVVGQTTAKYATNSTTTLSVSDTNGFSSGDVIIIQHVAYDTYEKRTLTTMSGATNLVVTAAPLTAVWPGDVIYEVSTAGAGSIAVGNATINLGGSGPIYVGQRGKPLLAEVNATSSGTLHVLGGTYLP